MWKWSGTAICEKRKMIKRVRQDGYVSKCCTFILSKPHQSCKLTSEQTLCRTTWNLDEWESYNQGYKEVIWRLVGGAEMGNRLVPHPRVTNKNQEGYLSCRGPPWRVRGPSPTPGQPAQTSSARRKAPITSGCKNPWELWLSEMEGCWNPRYSSWRARVQTYLLTD